jgi:cytochrome c
MRELTVGRWVLLVAVVIAIATGFGGWYTMRSNQLDIEHRAAAVTGGDPQHGRQLVRLTGCTGCHQIPHVGGANGTVGPPLTSLARRVYIGVVLNTPENLIRWLRDPRSIDPMAAMPNVGLSEQDARDVAAFLYTLD